MITGGEVMSEQPKLVILPPDWVAVPREATKEMQQAAWNNQEYSIADARANQFTYSAMLSAAPQLPDETEKLKQQIRDEVIEEVAQLGDKIYDDFWWNDEYRKSAKNYADAIRALKTGEK